MAAPSPCLGYPTKTAAVEALRLQGMNVEQIAEQTGISVKNVYNLQKYARDKNREPGRERKELGAGAPKSFLGEATCGDQDLLRLAREHAARRGITTDQLTRQLVFKALADNIVDAVLDDADELRRT